MNTISLKGFLQTISLAIISVLLVTGCQKKDRLKYDFTGDVMVSSMELSGYEAIVNHSEKTITVSVSETFDSSLMEITKLELSEGATANMKVGDNLNMNVPQVIRVINGNVFLDYTIVVVHDSASILSLRINDQYSGIINQNAATIVVRVPETVNVEALTVTMTLSEGASCNVNSGEVLDLTDSKQLTVTYNTAVKTYTLTVLRLGKPKALFVGLASTVEGLGMEEKTAADWMLSNVDAAQYASFEDIALSNVDLSECEVIWWHFHVEGGLDNMSKFDSSAPAALEAVAKLKEYYNAGGHFLLTRFATYYAVKLGAVKDNANPNNCWGGKEQEGEIVGGPWDFRITGHEQHDIYKNMVMNSGEPSKLFMFDKGYRVTNSTCQWHIGSDWGGYADLQTWRDNNGGVDLGYGGDGAVVVWEYPSEGNEGNILCIGSGCYDWYAHGVDTSSDQYHSNVAKLTENSILYINQ